MFGTYKEYKKWTRSRNETRRHLRGGITRTYIRGPDDASETPKVRVTGDTHMPPRQEVPFQRVSVLGIHTTGVPLEDLIRAATLLIEGLDLRRHYMDISNQSFNENILNYLTEHDLPSKRYRDVNHSRVFNDALLNLDAEAAEQYLQLTGCSSEEILTQPTPLFKNQYSDTKRKQLPIERPR